MLPSPYPTLRKPVALLEKCLQPDVKGLMKSLTKAAGHLATGKHAELVGDTEEILASLGIKDEPGAVAWVLTRRALERAMLAIAFEANLPLGEVLPKLTKLSVTADQALDAAEVELSPNFFQKPRELPVLAQVKPLFKDWLVAAGMEGAPATTAADRLPGYFVFALGEEWNRAPAAYAETFAATKHPFAQAGEWELAWLRYNGYLQQQVDGGLFDMPFSLRQLYIPLRASYSLAPEECEEDAEAKRIYDRRRGRREPEKRVLADLKTILDQWVANPKRDDPVRLIRGGPGCGKSSFLKMYAAHRTEFSDSPRVLYLPLHQIDHKGDLEQALGTFFRETKLFPGNPFAVDGPSDRLLLLFDGLDELALQGRLGAEAANQFTQEVLRKLDLRNTATVQAQVILSGRDVAVQACAHAFRGEGKILNVEPYVIDARLFKEKSTSDTSDQRTQWWENYGERSGHGYLGLPVELQGKEELDEITKWPLLNHLVALSYESGNRDFSNLNRVYRSLLEDVYQRAYEQKKTHRAISNLKKNDFFRVLEEIALAAWHGKGRTTTIREIQEHCQRAGLERLLGQFRSDQENSRVADLLLAFYFRQAGTTLEGDASYEFTHKSFGEYLVACRLVRGVERINKEALDHTSDVDDGWDEKKSLLHWIELCGPTSLDVYVMSFLRDEIALRTTHQPIWPDSLIKIMDYLIQHGLPLEDCKGISYQEMTRQDRNTTEALLGAINAYIRTYPSPHQLAFSWGSNIDEENKGYLIFLSRCAYDLLEKLNSIDNYNSLPVFRDCLSHINFNSCLLSNVVLDEANLEEAKFQDASLRYSSFFRANFRRANFDSAEMQNSNFINANFQNAVLRYADLEGSMLQHAILTGADLQDVNLQGADLSGAFLSDSNLEGVHANNTTVWPNSVWLCRYYRQYDPDGEDYYLRSSSFATLPLWQE